MTKQNKNWEERLIKEYREQDFECEEEKEIFWLDKLKTLMIDTLEKITKENFTMIENIEGYNSAVKDLNQRIEEIKKRFL